MHIALYLLFPVCMLHAALSDLRSAIIPNRIPVGLVVLFALAAPVAGLSAPAILGHVGGALLAFAVTFALYAAGGIGGGDAKLIAATSLWMGWGQALLEYVLVFALAGGLIAVLVLLLRSLPLPAWAVRNPWLCELTDSRRGVPYGAALAIGGLAAFRSSELAQRLWL